MSLIDPIDRNALMIELGIVKNCEACKYHEAVYCNWKPNAVDVCEAICDAPTVEPESHWIPVSERLPDEPNVYMVTNSNGDVVRFVFNNNDSSREYWLRCAKAWMPLPERYREEGEHE